ncbi:hypothetical protein EB796_014098 [Bugula neritina]|uniref:Uncharacterized protein n=1 Tax=Bugula neritina TaxID=10212 RepID=A0A7J7JNK2_BUGNE|nr:hypothetical protein EB796_014098 [Bugula neritina]
MVNINVKGNLLKKVPPGVCKLKMLEVLDISDNQLKALPKTVHKAAALHTFVASGNKVRKLPPKIGDSKTLRYVRVQNNLLKTLPKTIYKIPVEVDASNNLIKELPKIALTKKVKDVHLNKLFLSKNQLQTLPEGFEFLQCMTHLDISHNQFQELPASVGHLRFLEFLDISHNDIGIIHEDFCKLSEFMNQVKRKNQISVS